MRTDDRACWGIAPNTCNQQRHRPWYPKGKGWSRWSFGRTATRCRCPGMRGNRLRRWLHPWRRRRGWWYLFYDTEIMKDENSKLQNPRVKSAGCSGFERARRIKIKNVPCRKSMRPGALPDFSTSWQKVIGDSICNFSNNKNKTMVAKLESGT